MTLVAAEEVQVHKVTGRTRPGRFLRSMWRAHFYAALFATPVLLVMSVTGLVIMYSDPITTLLRHDQTGVSAQGRQTVGLSESQRAADTAAPTKATLFRVVTPANPDQVTQFFYSTGPTGVPYYQLPDSSVTYVNVDPYTAKVTATGHPGDDIVGLANRLHGFLNNDSLTIPLPSLAHWVNAKDNPDLITDVSVGDVIIEISMGWALVLTLSGLYLWWPRRSQKGKRLLVPRVRKKGRLRWRELHASSGILAVAILLVFITTGMPWSSYWGKTWSTVSAKLTPGSNVDAPSTPVKAGDLDRFGHRISWATREDTVPASAPDQHLHQGGIHGGNGSGPATTNLPAGVPSRLSLTDVALAATLEGMHPGYGIVLPIDDKAKADTPTYGSYQLSNAWPGRLSTEATVYLDQFTGKRIARSDTSSYGTLGQYTELGVLTHMGTQFGLLDRIVMTSGVVLLLISIGTSLVMWWKRRPAGGAGLPKRPTNPRLPKAMLLSGLLVGVVYPLWGVSAILVLLIDRFLVQRVPRLRNTFGMPH